MWKVLTEIYRTMKADFGSGCDWSFTDKFVFRWYRNYIKPKLSK